MHFPLFGVFASGWLPGTRRCSMPRFHRLFWHNAADLDFCLQSTGFRFPFKFTTERRDVLNLSDGCKLQGVIFLQHHVCLA